MAKSVYQTHENRTWADGSAPADSHGGPDPSRQAADAAFERALPELQPAAVTDAHRHASKLKVKRDEMIFFTTQLAVMVDTGVTLSEALDAISGQSEQSTMNAVVSDLSEQVKAGVEFSVALEKYPRIFTGLFVALMKAAEISGTMGPMLQRTSKYLKQERETIKRVKGAMIYPACMLTFCALVVIALLVFILPRFERIYAGKGAILPAPTRLLLGMSHGLVTYWPLVIVATAGACVGLWFFFRSPGGKRFVDTVRIRVPIIGMMYRKAYLARSLRTMATMISTGVGLLDGLEVTSRVAGNQHFSEIWLSVARQAREGFSLSEELANHSLVPSTVVHMISAGEKSGQLAQVMERIAGFCEDDVKEAVKGVTSLVEPLMIITMGFIIGGIAMALLLPVFSLSRVIAH